MEKSYQPRFMRNLGNPVSPVTHPVFKDYKLNEDGTFIVCEFESLDPSLFELSVQFAAGIVPSEVGTRFKNGRLLSLDKVDDLTNIMFNFEKNLE